MKILTYVLDFRYDTTTGIVPTVDSIHSKRHTKPFHRIHSQFEYYPAKHKQQALSNFIPGTPGAKIFICHPFYRLSVDQEA
jgi:hypothetical protein